MQVGDAVLFVPQEKQPVPYRKGEYRYVIGKVYQAIGAFVQIVDVVGKVHVEYVDKVVLVT